MHTAANSFESLGFIEAAQEVHEEFLRLAAKNHGGLDDWFRNEKWVNVRKPKKGGGFEPCGRSDSKTGKNQFVLQQTRLKILLKRN